MIEPCTAPGLRSVIPESQGRLIDPVKLYEQGYHDLISVIPPGAQLTPTSKIDPAAIGKIPGRRLGTGMWAGYDWRRTDASDEDVRRWMVQGANVGLRTDRFPAIDIDCTDDELAALIERTALRHFGAAPRRVGRAPKLLLLFRTDEPFTRMRLWFKRIGGEQHLIEVLGQGQQFVLHGTHPQTERAYVWLDPVPPAAELTTITHEQATTFLTEVAELLYTLNIETEREGDGRPSTRVAQDPESLAAPSIELLRQCVELIPNDNDLYPSRTDYLTMGYAIRAAAGADEGEGLELFQEWAAKWEGNDRSDGNPPDVVEADWDRMRAPYSVGWGWLCEQARPYGFNDAALEFAVESERPAPDADALPDAPEHSDQWLAERVVQRERGRLHYVPQKGCYLVWHNGKWEIDAELLAEDVIKQSLRRLAAAVSKRGATDKERRDAQETAKWIASAARANAVAQFIRSDRDIAVSLLALDSDPWALNTPAGIVNLQTGQLAPADPQALCTRSTAVAPEFGNDCPLWKRFLDEVSGHDAELVAYLKRLAGYALTGRTNEQALVFLFGDGGNGKTVFLNTLQHVMADYAVTAPMSTFQLSRLERPSNDLAMLRGARLVTASETRNDGRWDEARLKSLTGGERITARRMYGEFETFTPECTLILAGNRRPAVRSVDDALKRRLQIVPFTTKPEHPDPELPEKLVGEAPAILAWMVEGCLEWQRTQLAPPHAVATFTDEYFTEQDVFGQWLTECCQTDLTHFEEAQDLYASYRRWSEDRNEILETQREFSALIAARGFVRAKHPGNRRAGFRGIRLASEDAARARSEQ